MKDDPPEAIRDVKESAWKEVNDFVKKERSHSAPGPNGVPYIHVVYKKCPALLVATFPSNLEKRNNISMLEKVRGFRKRITKVQHPV